MHQQNRRCLCRPLVQIVQSEATALGIIHIKIVRAKFEIWQSVKPMVRCTKELHRELSKYADGLGPATVMDKTKSVQFQRIPSSGLYEFDTFLRSLAAKALFADILNLLFQQKRLVSKTLSYELFCADRREAAQKKSASPVIETTKKSRVMIPPERTKSTTR